MSVELYLTILLFSVTLTILLTEALKRLLNAAHVPYRANAVALDAAMVASTLVSIIIKNILDLGLSLSLTQVTRLLLVILSTWLVSMFVYDKLMQTIKQYKKYKQEKVKEKKKNVEKLCIETISKHIEMGEGSSYTSHQNNGTDSGIYADRRAGSNGSKLD